MFVDYAKVHLKAGDGGDGCMAFRREKFVPRGGPSGGHGGRGGHIYFRSSAHLNTLLPFRYNPHYQAERGRHGSGNKRRGKDGADLIIDVPVGTQIIEEGKGLLADLDRPGEEFLICRGGRGGRGNSAFATPTRQAPRRHEEGFPGEARSVILELKILADVGLIGYPNAGKSTLISVISAARPRIADYPFTTLTPHLGVVSCGDYKSFVVADIPGLIEGAHSGSGLGDRFLRHVERTRLLLHMVDVSGNGPEDPAGAAEAIQNELKLFDPALLRKPQVLVASKMDSADAEKVKKLTRYAKRKGLELLEISAVTGAGVERLKQRAGALLGVETE